uniref:Uncharacterized protein n=1 Tax=mine drainage metagenome TaxID=410659 RepID=E6PJ20_9ZZZZ
MILRFFLALALLPGLLALSAPSPTPSLRPMSAAAIVDRMLDRNPGLASYSVRVHVTTHMFSFPFLSPTLEGTSYYKRPSKFVVVFDRVPAYAAGFSKIFNNVGDPGAWSHDNVVSYDGTRMWSGRPVYVLKVAPRQYSDILAYAHAIVDPENWELVVMTWHYRDGGTISMHQWYRREHGYDVLAEQSAEINFRVHASSHATYGKYQLNVPIANTVFTGGK